MKYRCLVLLALLPFAALCAQDITPSPLVWLATDDNPDEFPLPRDLPVLELPLALKEVNEPGYVEYRLSVSTKGKVSAWGRVATSTPFERELPELSANFDPAKRAGSAVASEVALCYIYNPAAAGPDLADATPRVLAVQPPIFPELGKAQDTETRVVRVAVEIDAKGAVTTAKALGEGDQEFAEAAAVAVRRWRFAPAKSAGQPVAGSLEVPVAFQKPAVFSPGKVNTLPKPIQRVAPDYPYALRRAGIGGDVYLVFTISVEGRVVGPFAQRSDHPGFEDAALAALRQWRFEPAMQEGRPVPCSVGQLVSFGVNGSSAGIQSFKVTVPKSWPANLPEGMRFDVPPQLQFMELPVYPLEDLQAKRHGKVTVAYVIDASGQVTNVTALPGTASPAMALAAAAAMERFKFKPATRQGEPCHALLRIDFEFSPDGNTGHCPVTKGTMRALRLLDETSGLVRAKELDQRPRARWSTTPEVHGRRGEAVVEFVLDSDGIPRVPRVVSASDPALGYAAVQAIINWRFQRPMAGGKYVDTIVRMPFKFK